MIANLQLKEALGLGDKELDTATISFTTTDVDAAMCVSGLTLQQVRHGCEAERARGGARAGGGGAQGVFRVADGLAPGWA